jgi:hypothetical protein
MNWDSSDRCDANIGVSEGEIGVPQIIKRTYISGFEPHSFRIRVKHSARLTNFLLEGKHWALHVALATQPDTQPGIEIKQQHTVSRVKHREQQRDED